MSIHITGDTHTEFSRFNTDAFPEQKAMTKDDYVIVCGDFGIWDDSKEERYWLDWLDKKPFTTLFVDGNHENFDLLKKISVTKWHGGKVQYIRDSVIHLMRGQVFEIQGLRFFTMGGASSNDIQDGILEPDDPDFKHKQRLLKKKNARYRVNHVSWWAEEMPSDDEYETARRNLSAHNWEVDYIVTHCCPTRIVDILGKEGYKANRLTDFFQEISERCVFKHWYHGHYHDYGTMLEKYSVLCETIIPVPLYSSL